MEQLNDLIAKAATSRIFVVIVGPPESGKSSIAMLFQGIHIPLPTISETMFIDHWNDTPCCKIIDNCDNISDQTIAILSGLNFKLRTRHMYQKESWTVPSSVVVTMTPDRYQHYKKFLFRNYYLVTLGGSEPVISCI